MTVRGVLLGAFIAGLGVSITLAETALALLTLLLLWRLRDPAVRAAARWPLWPSVLAFSAVTDEGAPAMAAVVSVVRSRIIAVELSCELTTA